MEPWILSVSMTGSAYSNIWRLTPDGDLAFEPGGVGEVNTDDLISGGTSSVYARPDVPVADIQGNVVRSKMCGDANNTFSTISFDGYCVWNHNFATRADYNQDTQVCVKLQYYYDLQAAASSFNGGQDDNGPFLTGADYDWFAPSFETGAFDHESYVIGSAYSRASYGDGKTPYTLNGVGYYYQVNMRNFRKTDAVKYEPGSTTEYAEESMVQTPTFCERLNAVYIGTVTIFSFTMILWGGKTLALTCALFAQPNERHETLIDYPFIGVVWPGIMWCYPPWKKRLTEIEERRQKKKSDETILSRVLGLRAWLGAELHCGAFTFTSTLQDPARWLEYGTLDSSGNPRTSVKFWEALCYPLVLPFSPTFYKALRQGPCCTTNLYTLCWFAWACTAWGMWFISLMIVVLAGTWSITFFSDHSITIKIIEDFPQAVLGYYYDTEVRSNQEAVFSATVSLIILFRLILYYGYTMTNESVKEIKDGTKQKERALHRLYGDITPGQAVWMTCAQPWIMSFYVMTGPWTIICLGVPKRRVTSTAHVAPSGRGLKL